MTGKNSDSKLASLLKIGRPAQRLLASSGLVFGGFATSTVFVSLFFYVASGSVDEMALYGLGRYVGLIIISGIIVKVFPQSSPRQLFRIGLILTAAFYLLIIVLRTSAVGLVVPLGLFNGAAAGIYWFGNNTLAFDVLSPDERSHYYGLSFAIMSILNVAMPLAGGLIISRVGGELGYVCVFGVSLVSFCLAWWTSRKLQTSTGVGAVSMRHALIVPPRQRGWSFIWIAIALHGFKQGGADLGMIVLVELATHSSSDQGIYVSIASLAGVASSVIAGRLPPLVRGRTMWIGALGYGMALILLLFGANFAILLVYGLVSGFAYPGLMVSLSSVVLDVIASDPSAAQLRGEYVLSREIATNVGRIVAISLLIGLMWFLSVTASILVVLCVAAIFQLVAAFLGRHASHSLRLA
ncbi:MFS transporter [Acidithrix ferrooxidans]|uniref:Major facilitator superfamily protein n=1 Tax=Acidithrix ferrooxidans TaxID=1280514 RepID=A0A0D8HES9_9ACTN|nr:MFS transporter [Acidithrix ferrooxidans]KJF16423.1 major facilitator superfamily protein [Acidithrix ferrooxidans]